MRGIVVVSVLSLIGVVALGLVQIGLYDRLQKCSDHAEEVAYQLWQGRCKDRRFNDLYCQRN